MCATTTTATAKGWGKDTTQFGLSKKQLYFDLVSFWLKQSGFGEAEGEGSGSEGGRGVRDWETGTGGGECSCGCGWQMRLLKLQQQAGVSKNDDPMPV